MKPNIKQDRPPDVVFQEYSKDVIAFFNGFGSVFHTVKAKCRSIKNASIEHRFGADEGGNFNLKNFSLKEANNILLMNRKRGIDGIAFGLFGKKPTGFLSYEELTSLENEKRFRINWEKSFGKVKDVYYVWLWDKCGMFPFSFAKGEYKSSFKVVYPTRKLILRLIVNSLYPIESNPCLAVINPKEAETGLMQLYPTDLKNEKLSYNYQSFQSSKCFKIEINNPQLGFTYEMRWIIETVSQIKITN